MAARWALRRARRPCCLPQPPLLPGPQSSPSPPRNPNPPGPLRAGAPPLFRRTVVSPGPRWRGGGVQAGFGQVGFGVGGGRTGGGERPVTEALGPVPDASPLAGALPCRGQTGPLSPGSATEQLKA